MRTHHVLTLAALVAVAACSDSPIEPEPSLPAGQPRPAVTVVTDTTLLNSYVQSGGDAIVTILAEPGAPAMTADLANDIELQLESTVAAPVVNGQTLQATDVAFSETNGTVSDKYAYVTYAMRGEPTLGAVDVFQITGGEEAKLRSRAIFTDADVYSAAVSGDRLYLTTSSSDPAFTERAVLEVVVLDNNGGLPSTYSSLRFQLPSFAGTSVHVQNGKVWAVSGTGGPNTGGLTVFQASNMARLATITLDDARGVAGSATSGLVVVAQGTPGRTNLFNHTTNARIGTAIASGGAATPEARGDVSVDGNWAFVAASEGGTRILRVDGTGGTVRVNLPAPIVSGIAAELRTVNGVTTYREGNEAWIFTANGEAGVYAYYSNYPAVSSTGTPTVSLMGRLAFPASISANFARADTQGEWLVVASGLGGLRILEID
ncbi:MAG: hypothetical protein SFW08_08815 [Gemmatimonadaceae bacterium]|nr:hypothetical protein [Gemmatimonadaceae bacterium]